MNTLPYFTQRCEILKRECYAWNDCFSAFDALKAGHINILFREY
jgi:hypothetical protein